MNLANQEFRLPPNAEPTQTPWHAALTSHIPAGQFFSYLVVGGFNTLFGFGLYALLTAALQSRFQHGYLVANLLAGLISITFSYFGYKWFVFRTKGKYLREWLRAVGVYSSAILVSTALLPVFVFLIRRTTGFASAAPYLAGALVIALTAIYSFFGHRNFSFRREDEE
jgi:putative flippase GtrA